MDCSSYINTSLDLNIIPYRAHEEVPVSTKIQIYIYISLLYVLLQALGLKCLAHNIFIVCVDFYRRRRWKATFSPWG